MSKTRQDEAKTHMSEQPSYVQHPKTHLIRTTFALLLCAFGASGCAGAMVETPRQLDAGTVHLSGYGGSGFEVGGKAMVGLGKGDVSVRGSLGGFISKGGWVFAQYGGDARVYLGEHFIAGAHVTRQEYQSGSSDISALNASGSFMYRRDLSFFQNKVVGAHFVPSLGVGLKAGYLWSLNNDDLPRFSVRIDPRVSIVPWLAIDVPFGEHLGLYIGLSGSEDLSIGNFVPTGTIGARFEFF